VLAAARAMAAMKRARPAAGAAGATPRHIAGRALGRAPPPTVRRASPPPTARRSPTRLGLLDDGGAGLASDTDADGAGPGELDRSMFRASRCRR
jgi:hypothetical protein